MFLSSLFVLIILILNSIRNDILYIEATLYILISARHQTILQNDIQW